MTSTATATIPTTGVWTPDPAHTQIEFTARHLVVTKVRGRFEKYTGSVTFDGEPTSSKWQLSIETGSVNSGQERRDEHLRGDDFFDSAKYPTMEFVSTSVEQVNDHTLKVTGDLTIKDKTNSVVLDVEVAPVAAGPMGERLPISATTEINRDDWGLNYNMALEQGGVLVSSKIQIEIDGQLKKD